LDVQDAPGWKPFLEKYGWKWFGPKDKMHFDYQGSGTKDLRNTAVLAFQKLWNKNNPTNRISEDGTYGPQVEKCLNSSPSGGFGAFRVLQLVDPPLRGDDVKKLQEALIKAGFQLTADGVYGSGTDEAVKAFQKQKGLTADGKVGPASRRELFGGAG
ncbi:MAG: peptidoglycan-binding protein, partial [Leptolyngbyaceae cyanobacterium SL_7_1]|nr:peptidoglycan-binding protein [Leptolyngbyaceae cyanobacterium SL_7_1]